MQKCIVSLHPNTSAWPNGTYGSPLTYVTAWHAYYHKNIDYQQCEYQQKLVVYTMNEIKTIDSLILEMV